MSPARELDRMRAEGVLDDQLTAVVVFGSPEKKGGGNVGAQPMGRARNLAHGIVDMRAKRHARLIAIEERRKDVTRQGGADEDRVTLQCAQDDVPRLRVRRASLCGSCRLCLTCADWNARGCAAVLPVALPQQRLDARRAAPDRATPAMRTIIASHLPVKCQHDAPSGARDHVVLRGARVVETVDSRAC